jgi:GT2 family glycosyltransferase
VVDNGSTDDSVSIIRSTFDWPEVVETRANLGFSRGNNVGIRLALERKAEYVWLLNNDTVVEASTLSAMVRAAESDPTIGEVGSVLYYWHAPDQVQAWGGGFINLWTGIGRHLLTSLGAKDLHYLTAASALLPASVLKQVGLLDEGYFMYWEDSDLSFRIRAAGYKLAVAEDARLLHKENASTGKKSARMDRYMSASGIRFLRKFAAFPLVPISIFVFGRAFKRFLYLEWARGWAVLAGIFGDGRSRIHPPQY